MSVGLALGIVLLAGVLLGFVVRGPLVVRVPEGVERRPVSSERLRESVRLLCNELAPRHYQSPGHLDRIADWIAQRFREAGLEVSEIPYRLPEGEFRNVVGVRRGIDPDLGVIVVGAHYDTYFLFPGADDNASGVAVLLELARTLPDAPPRRTQYFVAFVNEEPPFFPTRDMGSYHVARKLADGDVRVGLMISVEMVGYFSDESGSQRSMGAVLRPFYPSRADFIGVVGDMGSGRSIRWVKRGMLAAHALPVYSFRGPRIIPGITWSDHYWFRRLGLPAVMVTDTAFLRNPHYHRSTDTPDTLDYGRMAGVVQGLHCVLQDES